MSSPFGHEVPQMIFLEPFAPQPADLSPAPAARKPLRQTPQTPHKIFEPYIMLPVGVEPLLETWRRQLKQRRIAFRPNAYPGVACLAGITQVKNFLDDHGITTPKMPEVGETNVAYSLAELAPSLDLPVPPAGASVKIEQVDYQSKRNRVVLRFAGVEGGPPATEIFSPSLAFFDPYHIGRERDRQHYSGQVGKFTQSQAPGGAYVERMQRATGTGEAFAVGQLTLVYVARGE